MLDKHDNYNSALATAGSQWSPDQTDAVVRAIISDPGRFQFTEDGADTLAACFIRGAKKFDMQSGRVMLESIKSGYEPNVASFEKWFSSFVDATRFMQHRLRPEIFGTPVGPPWNGNGWSEQDRGSACEYLDQEDTVAIHSAASILRDIARIRERSKNSPPGAAKAPAKLMDTSPSDLRYAATLALSFIRSCILSCPPGSIPEPRAFRPAERAFEAWYFREALRLILKGKAWAGGDW